MNQTVTVSAPGKLLLLGDHAVVYGYPSLVTSVNQRLHLTATLLDDALFRLDAPDVGISNYSKTMHEVGTGEVSKGASYIEQGLVNFLLKYQFKGGVAIKTHSEFSSQYGFGSSSASIVCLIKALAVLTGVHLNNKELFDLSYKTLIDVAGIGSGFDLAAAIYGGIIYYVTPGKIIEPVQSEGLSLVVGYTGVKVNTASVVREVAQLRKDKPDFVNQQFQRSEECVHSAKKAIAEKDWPLLGNLLDKNQTALEKLTVSSSKLDSLIKAAREAGAYGAKLSGAGRGDCMIALVSSEKKESVAQAIASAGGEVIPIETNVAGVVVE